MIRRMSPQFSRLVLAAVLLTGSAVLRPSRPACAAEDSTEPSLAERQRIVEERVGRLEDRMFQLSRVLRKSEPEKAAQLLQSLSAARGLLVRQRMQEIIKRLNEKGYADALDQQQEVQRDLQLLLKILLEGPDELEERKEEIDRLEAIRQALNEVIREQRDERDAALAASGRPPDALAEMAAKLRDLLTRQQALSAAAANADSRELAQKQGALQQETEALSEALGEQNRQAPSENLSQAMAGVSQAADSMNAAEGKLAEGRASDARSDQAAAEKALSDALKELQRHIADEIARRQKQSPVDRQAQAQRDTKEKTRRLLDEMKGGDGQCGPGEKPPSSGQSGGKKGQSGAQGDGQQSAQGDQKQSGGPSSTPPDGSPEGRDQPQAGAEQVEEAIPHQEDAEQNLERRSPGDASESQRKAIEKLQQARKEVDDKLEQLRKEQQEELLAALESRFRAMLARQLEINQVSERLAELGSDRWNRTDQLQLAGQSENETWVAEEADKALYILKDEGTTVVFPQVVEHLRDDAKDVAARLAAADLSPSVRVMEQAIAETLKELIEAIERKKQEDDSQGGGGGGDQSGPTPLLPGSAELKLLRSCQLRVNEATLVLEEDRQMPEGDPARIEERLRKLAERQAQVHEMARAMHESLRKAQ